MSPSAPSAFAGLKARVSHRLATAARALAPEGTDLPALELSPPPRVDLGDFAVPCFPLARSLRRPPPAIAQALAEALSGPGGDGLLARAEAAGPYLNLTLDRGALFSALVGDVLARGEEYGKDGGGAGRPVMVEFSSPNTNKPQHLGHVRNNVLGDAVSRILAANGHRVVRANLVNDRGIHICKSMLAYQRWGQGRTPESEGIKGDHFVGEYYVLFEKAHKAEVAAEAQRIRESGEQPDPALAEQLATERSATLQDARALLRRWEAGEPEVRALWQRMNAWVLEGFSETYRRMGIAFDRYYFESETYLLGRETVLSGVERGVLQRREDGSVWIDLSAEDLGEKLLLRRDGTSVYMTQDVGTALLKMRDYGLARSIYVVASEQDHHFQVLFSALRRMGYAWADHLHHLSYGMVYLPEGRMKTREGTVVDADALMTEVVDAVRDLVTSRAEEHGRDGGEGSAAVAEQARLAAEITDEIAVPVGLGALRFYLLRFNPRSDVTFNPRESVSLQGDTGPYVQYTAARIPGIEEKARAEGVDEAGADLSLLGNPEELALAAALGRYPEVVREAGEKLNPSLVASFLLELARAFNKFYKQHRVVGAESAPLAGARLGLSRACGQVLRNGLGLLGIEAPSRM